MVIIEGVSTDDDDRAAKERDLGFRRLTTTTRSTVCVTEFSLSSTRCLPGGPSRYPTASSYSTSLDALDLHAQDSGCHTGRHSRSNRGTGTVC